MLKVMTFNIHHGKGRDGKTNISRILDEIMQSDADIVALQEVDRFQPRSYFRDQLAILTKGTGMNSCYAASLRLGISQYGNTILSRWPITGKSIIYMDGGLERRSILIATILINSSKSVTVINTHFGVRAFEYRWQMPILCKYMADIPEPAVLMGDFNMEPSNEILKTIDSSWYKLELEPHQATMQNGKQIDHIFVNSGFRNASIWVQKTIASDHHAVVADLPHFLE